MPVFGGMVPRCRNQRLVSVASFSNSDWICITPAPSCTAGDGRAFAGSVWAMRLANGRFCWAAGAPLWADAIPPTIASIAATAITTFFITDSFRKVKSRKAQVKRQNLVDQSKNDDVGPRRDRD